MFRLTIRNTVAAMVFGTISLCSAIDEDFNAVNGPNVRVMRHEDGSRTMFRRSPNNLTLTKKTISANGVLEMVTIYRMDANTNPLSCKIYDGQNQELFKIRYGYRKSDGQLVEEQMFDSRAKRKDADGNEIPVRRLVYTYDANGKRSAPIAITLKAGKRAEEVYKGKDNFTPQDNPFYGEKPAGSSSSGKH